MNPDGIQLSLFTSRINAVCEEMGSLLGRVALSPNIRDRLDYSCALFDACGRLLGQATHIPVHLGSMAHAMAGVVSQFEWQRGHCVVFNDPFQGGTHLPDVTFVSPVFHGDLLVGFAANRAHHANIGADTPGSMPISRSLDEEGVLIPPRLVVNAGQRDAAWFSDIAERMGSRPDTEGDFAAQLSANQLGVRRTALLAEHYGAGRWRALCGALQDHGRTLAQQVLATIPRGHYVFEDFLDDDGLGHEDLRIRVEVAVDGDDVQVSFDGTAPQVPGNLNCPMSVTAAAVGYVFRCLIPDHAPACHGTFSAWRIEAPEACLVNARAPAAVAAGNVETSMRIVDALCGALASALPDQIPAASQGTMNNIAMGARGENSWDYYETLAGGHGAGPGWHGLAARHSHMTNTLNTPVEVLERHYPLRIRRYALRPGSGGQGQFRGGVGVIREYQFLADARVSLLTERRRTAPWGLNHGGEAVRGSNLLDDKAIPGKCELDVKAGQCLRVETPGGGGYGKP
ncbi:MAG: hydantoinase B/oxoprolinase family protein [Xanthomonadales bacterium]|nr:hydantoinase B/oxoprolinase family protein [Xanthomonadales bacterium]